MTDAERIKMLEDQCAAAEAVIAGMRDENIRLQAKLTALKSENVGMKLNLETVIKQLRRYEVTACGTCDGTGHYHHNYDGKPRFGCPECGAGQTD